MRDKQENMIALMREILQDDYTELSVRLYTLTESFEDEAMCRLTCHLINADGSDMTVESEGVGVIDALFNGLRDRLADEYPSLQSIRFSQFNIRGLISVGDEHAPTSAAQAEATVGILNSADVEFIFQSTATSVSRAGMQATVRAAEYFVNSERTFVRLHEILEHYRSEGRTDLVDKYTELMSRVVGNTSYSEVVERIKKSM